MRQEGSGNHGKGRFTTGQGCSETLQKEVSWETWCQGFKVPEKQASRRNSTKVESIKSTDSNDITLRNRGRGLGR